MAEVLKSLSLEETDHLFPGPGYTHRPSGDQLTRFGSGLKKWKDESEFTQGQLDGSVFAGLLDSLTIGELPLIEKDFYRVDATELLTKEIRKGESILRSADLSDELQHLSDSIHGKNSAWILLRTGMLERRFGWENLDKGANIVRPFTDTLRILLQSKQVDLMKISLPVHILSVLLAGTAGVIAIPGAYNEAKQYGGLVEKFTSAFIDSVPRLQQLFLDIQERPGTEVRLLLLAGGLAGLALASPGIAYKGFTLSRGESLELISSS